MIFNFKNYSNSNGLDAWADADGLHVVHSEAEQLEGYPYDTYYQFSFHNEPIWRNRHNVTDNANDQGGFPGVATSPNRVHVTFTDVPGSSPAMPNPGFAKTRDRLNGNWQTSQELFDDATLSYIIANSAKLHGFYYDLFTTPPPIPTARFDLYTANRNLNSTSWSQPEFLLVAAEPGFAPIDAAVTADDKVHIVYGHEEYREWDATNGWSPPFDWAPHDYTEHARISPNSNDIFIIWNHTTSLKLRQRDFAPLAPQNLTATAGGTYDPVELNWDANTEADLYKYKIYRASNYSSTPPASGYNLIATLNAYSGGNPVTSYIDEEVFAYPSSWWVHYKIRAVDLEGNHSSYSDIASYNAVLFRITVKNEEGKIIISDYSLNQNFPNPFNPATTIQFGLRDSGPVELSVYNLSGQKISTLVNGYLEEGVYQVTWDGKDARGKTVSSGIYIYQLKAGKKRITKKMLLAK
jgi:hypothetical protein